MLINLILVINMFILKFEFSFFSITKYYLVNIFLFIISLIISIIFGIINKNPQNSIYLPYFNRNLITIVTVSFSLLLLLFLSIPVKSILLFITIYLSLVLFNLLIANITKYIPKQVSILPPVKIPISKGDIDELIIKIKNGRSYKGEIILEKWLDGDNDDLHKPENNSSFQEYGQLYEIYNKDLFKGLYTHQAKAIIAGLESNSNLFLSLNKGHGKTHVIKSISYFISLFHKKKSLIVVPVTDFINYRRDLEFDNDNIFYKDLINNHITLNSFNSKRDLESNLDLVDSTDILLLTVDLIDSVIKSSTILKSILKNYHSIIFEDIDENSAEDLINIKGLIEISRSMSYLNNEPNNIIISSNDIENINNTTQFFFGSEKYELITQSQSGKNVNTHKILYWLPTLIRRSKHSVNLTRKSFLDDSLQVSGKLSTLVNRKILLFDPSSYIDKNKEGQLHAYLVNELTDNSIYEVDVAKITVCSNLKFLSRSHWDQFDVVVLCGEFKDLVHYYDEIRLKLKEFGTIVFIISSQLLTQHFYHVFSETNISEHLSIFNKVILPIGTLGNPEIDILTSYKNFWISQFLKIIDKSCIIKKEIANKIQIFNNIGFNIGAYFDLISLSDTDLIFVRNDNQYTQISSDQFSITQIPVIESGSGETIYRIDSGLVNKYYIENCLYYFNDKQYFIEEITDDAIQVFSRDSSNYSYYNFEIEKDCELICDNLLSKMDHAKNNVNIDIELWRGKISESICNIKLIHESLHEDDCQNIDSSLQNEWEGTFIKLNFSGLRDEPAIHAVKHLLKALLQVKLPIFKKYVNIWSDEAIYIYSYIDYNEARGVRVDIMRSIYYYFQNFYEDILNFIYFVLIHCPCNEGCKACVDTVYCSKQNKTLIKSSVIEEIGKYFSLAAESKKLIEYKKHGVNDLQHLVELRDQLANGENSILMRISGNQLSIKNLANVEFFNEDELKSDKFIGICQGTSRVAIKPGLPEKETLIVLAHEYTHNWQSDGNMSTILRGEGIPYDGKLFSEGFAMWVEQHFLGFYQFEEEMQLNDILQYNEYGEGLDFFLYLEETYGFQYVFNFIKGQGADSWAKLVEESGVGPKIKQKEELGTTWSTDLIE